jgi:hypothetical protein
MIFYADLSDYVARQRERLAALETSNIPEIAVLSRVLAPAPGREGYPTTREVPALEVDALGLLGDRHRVAARGATGREGSLYPRGARIRQHRHLCAVSSHDCAALSEKLGVAVTPELLGANLLIDRLDGAPFSATDLPPATHLLVMPAGATEAPKPPIATLVHFVKQRGCHITGKAIADHYGDPRLVKAFREHARDNRGLICSVEYPVDAPARLRAGQRVALRFAASLAP